MAGRLADYTLDNGLTVLDTAATHICLCASEPVAGTSTSFLPGNANVLGSNNFGAGNAFGTPTTSTTPKGQKVSSVGITNAAISNSGTANWWAAVDNTNSRLLAHGAISNPQAVAVGGTFNLPSFDITMPDGST